MFFFNQIEIEINFKVATSNLIVLKKSKRLDINKSTYHSQFDSEHIAIH